MIHFQPAMAAVHRGCNQRAPLQRMLAGIRSAGAGRIGRFLFVGRTMMPDRATRGGTEHRMMTGHVAGHAAHRSAFQATLRLGRYCMKSTRAREHGNQNLTSHCIHLN